MSYSAEQRFQAAQWFFDIHDAQEPPPELVQDWVRWMDAEEGNRRAFESVQATYHQVATRPRRNVVATRDEPYDGDISVAEWRDALALAKPRRSRRPILHAVAAAVVILALALQLVRVVQGWAHPSSGEFSTGTAEHMQLTLADGSRVELGARSRLTVAFSSRSRDVRLDRGEAYFQIRKEADRPFRVHAFAGVITAVGTAFDVRTTPDRVTVTVSEGVVSLASDRASADAPSFPVNSGEVHAGPVPLRLARGQQTSYGSRVLALERAQVHQVDATQPARWREGWLVYRDEPLRDVIADVERYTERHITVDDSVPTNLRYTGAVFKSSVLEWLRALPEVFPVAVKSDGVRVNVVSERSSSNNTPH